MRVPGLLLGCRCAIYAIVAVAAALPLNATSAQQPYRRSAYRVAQAPAFGAPPPPASREGEGDAEPVLRPPERGEVESPEELVGPAPLPESYQVPLRQPADGLVIHADDGLISLAARGAAVADVLTALAELQGLNVITQDTVTGTLNTTLNRVPIQDALDVILQMTGHTWTRNKNIILVTSVAQASSLSRSSRPAARGL
ncbi:MAG: hypothetical protein CMJ64_07515 [Planctomycetaceae bacterium]|nr:hypothetical protein [Planctomycetaceae bacterium]